MLVGICGSICSGKSTVARYLVEHHGFKHLYLQKGVKAAKGSPPANEADDVGTEAGESALAPIPAAGSEASSANSSLEAMRNGQKAGSVSSVAVPVRPQVGPSQVFERPEDLLDFVTRKWRDRFVLTDIPSETVLDVFIRRPFFLLVSIDAPLSMRWRRFQQRATLPDDATISLEDFVTRNDIHLYNLSTGLQPLISRATVRLLNTSSSLAHLYATLGKLDIPNPDRLRPCWDTYFMALASLAAQRSNCMKRRVGCVLVGQERRVISTGYNGTPRGLRNCAEGGCPRCNDGSSSGVGLSTCLCIHAEENALLEAGRERIRDGCVLYCDTCPCLTCSIKICQVGIKEVVYANGYSMDNETAEVFRQAGVKLRQFIPPPNGLIHLEKLELY